MRALPAIACAAVACGVLAPSAGAALPAQVLGRRTRRRRRRRTVPAAEAGRRRQRPHPDRMGRGAARHTTVRFNWNGTDAVVGGAAAAGIEVLPFVTGAPSWAVKPRSVNRAAHALAPLNLPVKTGAQSSRLDELPHPDRPPLRAERHLLGRQPGRPLQADPHLADLERAELQILRRPAQPGRIREAGQALLPGDQRHRPRCQDDPRRALRGAARKRTYKSKPPQAYFATDFLEQIYKKTPGIKSQFDGRRPAPVHLQLPGHAPVTSKNCARVLKDAHDPGKGLWITELGWSSGFPSASNGRNGFEKGPQGQAKQLKGAFRLLEANQAKWKLKQVFWFSVDDAPERLQLLRRVGPLRPGLRRQALVEGLREVRRRRRGLGAP